MKSTTEKLKKATRNYTPGESFINGLLKGNGDIQYNNRVLSSNVNF